MSNKGLGTTLTVNKEKFESKALIVKELLQRSTQPNLLPFLQYIQMMLVPTTIKRVSSRNDKDKTMLSTFFLLITEEELIYKR